MVKLTPAAIKFRLKQAEAAGDKKAVKDLQAMLATPADPPKGAIRDPKIAAENARNLRQGAQAAAKTTSDPKPVTKLAREPSKQDAAHAKADALRAKRGPFAAAVPAASTATPGPGTSSSGAPATASVLEKIEVKLPHRNYHSALAGGARHPRPWRVGGGPEDNILSWIIYDASGHPVCSMPFIYSNQASLRAEAELVVKLVNDTKV